MKSLSQGGLMAEEKFFAFFPVSRAYICVDCDNLFILVKGLRGNECPVCGSRNSIYPLSKWFKPLKRSRDEIHS